MECVECATEFVNLNLYNQAASGESIQPLYLNFTRQCVKKCQRDTAIMSVRVLYSFYKLIRYFYNGVKDNKQFSVL